MTRFTLNRHGITHIETTRQAAEPLRPLAGRFAATLFTIGNTLLDLKRTCREPVKNCWRSVG